VVASKLAQACADTGVDYALIGGFAAGAYGSTVNTKDVDACVDVGPEEPGRVEALLEALQRVGFRVNVEALKKRAGRGRTILFLNLGLVRLDLMLRRPDSYWEGALRRRRRAVVEGQPYWLASPEDIALLKLVAARPKDLPVVRMIMASRFPELDLASLRREAVRLSPHAPDLPERVEAAIAAAEELYELASSEDEAPDANG
jgi:hypothetical protein